MKDKFLLILPILINIFEHSTIKVFSEIICKKKNHYKNVSSSIARFLDFMFFIWTQFFWNIREKKIWERNLATLILTMCNAWNHKAKGSFHTTTYKLNGITLVFWGFYSDFLFFWKIYFSERYFLNNYHHRTEWHIWTKIQSINQRGNDAFLLIPDSCA